MQTGMTKPPSRQILSYILHFTYDRGLYIRFNNRVSLSCRLTTGSPKTVTGLWSKFVKFGCWLLQVSGLVSLSKVSNNSPIAKKFDEKRGVGAST